jgi:hypothetical protein
MKLKIWKPYLGDITPYYMITSGRDLKINYNRLLILDR